MTNPSQITLALECSAGQASAAIGQNGTCLAMATHEAPHGHAAWMIPLAIDALKKSGHEFADLTHILAGRGPGSFTGIRVALAGAKGLALSLGIKAQGLSSLAALAASVRDDSRNIMTLVDTRRGSLFFQSFDPSAHPLGEIGDSDINVIADVINASSSPWTLAGDHAAQLKSLCPDHDIIISDQQSPDAAGLIRLFDAQSEQSVTSTSDHLEPLYLAAPILGPKKSANKQSGSST